MHDNPIEGLKLSLRDNPASLSGVVKDVTGYATHYHAYYVRPDWALRMRPTAVIGDHLFYREGAGAEDHGPYIGWEK